VSLVGPELLVDSIAPAPATGKLSDKSSTMEEEDWDCMDSASDLKQAANTLPGGDGAATVKGKKGCSSYLQELQQPATTPIIEPTASRLSIFNVENAIQCIQVTQLSNVEENVDDHTCKAHYILSCTIFQEGFNCGNCISQQVADFTCKAHYILSCTIFQREFNHGNHISQQVADFTCKAHYILSCTIFQGEFNHGNHISQQVAYFTHKRSEVMWTMTIALSDCA
jgi:hypothetical protein